MSEKTEQPSAKKLKEARKQGQLPRSRLLSSAAATTGGAFGFLAFAPDTAARLKGFTLKLLGDPASAPQSALYEGLGLFALALAPALAGAFTGALLAGLATAGLQLNPEAVAPKLQRLDPAAGFKRLFSLSQLGELARGLLVASLLSWLVWNAAQAGAGAALAAVRVDGAAGLSALLALLRPTFQRGLVVLLLLGVADYALARRRHVRQLMMTRQEVKQEHKQSEGDPHQKAKRKAIGRQLAMGGAARGVHKATAVVVNPTHIAIALRYCEAESDAPYIVAKGREEDALKLKRDAKALGIPVVRDIPLARSLVHFDVGEEIPEELYQAAAAVLKVALDAGDHPDKETP